MPTLFGYSNVYNTCILMLRRKGWRVWLEGKGTDAEVLWAERDGWDLVGQNPLELLGLVHIFEHKQPKTFAEYWWREDGPQLYQRVPQRRPKYISRSSDKSKEPKGKRSGA